MRASRSSADSPPSYRGSQFRSRKLATVLAICSHLRRRHLLGLVRPPGLRFGFLGPSEPSEGAAAVLRQGLLHGLERG
ncbi:hypothetical protein [Streptomyces canus]|uniref:hypothetical protein n=1 Tax=Streptomyces canus TaxID=58343 RepID=UPI0037F75DFA